MNILIVGGHAKANFLIKSFIESGHKVTVINKDKEFCQMLANTYGVVGVYGDGTKPFILKDAAAAEMDTVIALSNQDAANLVICEIAKKQFHVKNTFAVVNDPRNIRIFQRLGVDKVISSTEILTDMIEYEAVIDNLVNYLPLENEKIAVFEFEVDVRSPIIGLRVDQAGLPKDAILAYFIRDDVVLSPSPLMEFEADDRVILMAHKKDFQKITKLFWWR